MENKLYKMSIYRKRKFIEKSTKVSLTYKVTHICSENYMST